MLHWPVPIRVEIGRVFAMFLFVAPSTCEVCLRPMRRRMRPLHSGHRRLNQDVTHGRARNADPLLFGKQHLKLLLAQPGVLREGQLYNQCAQLVGQPRGWSTSAVSVRQAGQPSLAVCRHDSEHLPLRHVQRFRRLLHRQCARCHLAHNAQALAVSLVQFVDLFTHAAHCLQVASPAAPVLIDSE
jgi:hypothetical protein